MKLKRFPNYKQHDAMDCGPICLRIMLRYYGRKVSIHRLRRLCQVTDKGTNMLGIAEAAEKMGFETRAIRPTVQQLDNIQLPCILYWNQKHFVVLYKIEKERYYVSDPAMGLVSYKRKDFLANWVVSEEQEAGFVLMLAPNKEFSAIAAYENGNSSLGWRDIWAYLSRYKRLLLQLAMAMALGTFLNLIGPFLTQAIVDIGISTKDVNFITLILIAQLMIFVGSTVMSFLETWTLLHVSTRVNIAFLSDLLIKIMKLPMSFFDRKTHGDMIQRMSDQQRIENFLTEKTLSTLFFLINVIIFGSLLAVYNSKIFLVFMVSIILSLTWILIFMKYRKELDAKRFSESSKNQTYIVEMLQNIRDIKLNNAEEQKRRLWETMQINLFKLKIKSLTVSQYQSIGTRAIEQVKSIVIIYMAAKSVIDGDITLGGMMAIQYIIGMVSNPSTALLSFIQSYQDAKISLERLKEIYQTDDEVNDRKDYITKLPEDKSIEFSNITFRYYGAGNEPIFTKLSLNFPAGRTTAIVGASGSGKTTILKLLLRYYEPEDGEIRLGGKRLNDIEFALWRDSCGSVLQENFIYADSIARNIAVNEDIPDEKKIQNAIRIANMEEFVTSEPFGLATNIGTAGKGISQGQRQRLMIARAVYKDPAFLFLDEATNSLDANNERQIVEKLDRFFDKRTVIVVAHRLSTVRNADNIIVLEKGQVVEQGTHNELTAKRGKYYELVKNQLELGN